MGLKGPLHVICCILTLWLSAIAVAEVKQQPQGRAKRSILHYQNVLARMNGTKSIFTQRKNPYNQKMSDNSSSEAESKFLSPFSIVQFANEMCSVGGRMGFCVTALECTNNFGGSNIGSCMNGFGTCCYKAIKCGESSSMNVTYIQNDDYPSATSSSGSCTHSITRQDNVCHLRLDFDEFELSDPSRGNNLATNGQCLNDAMTVSGVSTDSLTYLCGKMPPVFHYYLDVRDVTGPTTFNFAMSSAVTQDRKWSIKITQIDCDRRIPQGCGQYFTGTTGDDLYSWNYGNNGMYLQGMNYAVCFRNEKDYCTHTFTDNGPSYVACTDVLMLPTANLGVNDLITPNGVDRLYCNFITLADTWPSPIETNNFGPTQILFWTDQANPSRYTTPQDALGLSPGYHFSWEHKRCTSPIG